MTQSICFILMPFGQKLDASGTAINFDAVYKELITPAVVEAQMQPVRADEELAGGIMHGPIFERLIVCDFAVADLTTGNANVFYELGVRHAVRPWSTVLLSASPSRMPFDVAPLRAIKYTLRADGGPDNVDFTRATLVRFLNQARKAAVDSPVFDLLKWLRPPVIDPTVSAAFRDSALAAESMKEHIANAGRQSAAALAECEASLGVIANADAGVVLALFTAYRDARAYDQMIALVQKMAVPLSQTAFVQEELALALNRTGHGDRAEKIVRSLVGSQGPSSEGLGILGRIYKDRWDEARQAGNLALARGLLTNAINHYVRGFETDWRDYYPGINALTLMEWTDPPDPRRSEIAPVVKYAVRRRIAVGQPDYWNYASAIELAVIGSEQEWADEALGQALALSPTPFMVESTVRNLRLIREARQSRGEATDWIRAIEDQLLPPSAVDG
jgi:MAP3K TRAFs-binding domain